MERLPDRGVSNCPIARFPSTMLPSSVSQARRSHAPDREGRMPERTLDERVEILEQNVQDLDSLPARVVAVEVQILQLRAEMRGGLLHEEVLSRIAIARRVAPPEKGAVAKCR
jgi:hypothetical protein